MRTLLILLVGLTVNVYGQNTIIGNYPLTGNANDVSNNGNNGIINGAKLTTDRFGNDSSAYLFDGVDDYIDLGTNYNLTSHSFVGWFKLNNYPVVPSYKAAIVSKLNNDSQEFKNYEIAIVNDKTIEVVIATGSTWDAILTTDTVIDNKWSFISYTYNDATNKSRLYLNSILIDSATISYFDALNTPLYIGARPQLSGVKDFFFDGVIDDIKLYNYDLTTSLIDSLYTLPNPLDTTSTLIDTVTISIDSIDTTSTPGDSIISPIDTTIISSINIQSIENTLNVYPNPFSNQLTIEVAEQSTIEIVDINGVIILTKEINKGTTILNTSSFSSAVYVVKVNNNNNNTKVIIKE